MPMMTFFRMPARYRSYFLAPEFRVRPGTLSRITKFSEHETD